MVDEKLIRSAMLLGENSIELLKNAYVVLFGLGGVGGHCAEALARGGVGHLLLVDGDTVSVSNLNRQLFATKANVGTNKTDAACERLAAVSDADIAVFNGFVLPDNLNDVFTNVPRPDYIIDAIDTISTKLALAQYAHDAHIPLISCMGMGNRLDPTMIRTGDVFDVTGCPVARVMRRELRKCDINRLTVCYSLETPTVPMFQPDADTSECDIPPRRNTPGSVSFVPGAAGMAMAGYVISSITRR